MYSTASADWASDKDEDNSPKNVNNVHNTSSQKYRQLIALVILFPKSLSIAHNFRAELIIFLKIQIILQKRQFSSFMQVILIRPHHL